MPDTGQAFTERYRILRPGGHFCVSDIVTGGSLPEAVRRSAELYAGCVTGVIDESEYRGLLDAIGFEEIDVVSRRRIDLPDEVLSDSLPEAERAALEEGGLRSVTVRGRVPLG
jgi:SAM-dependent methyltransferase